ncbi:histone lysine methyltransferase Set9 [Sporothrix epigloea]|uniref:Histone-lysine N-methyltransferase SET9 n=1 Tax=Sporothrix epigloea TaxID=1892477 RepID=A0ABP0DJU1_9PEZI
MPRARLQNDPPKKHTLTLAQIASYDDILTDSLVDHVFYWTTVPKNRPSYLPSRGVREEEITKIIQDHLVVDPDLQVAEKKFLATNGLGKFYRALKTESEKEDFRRHLCRYMQIYLPDCPFEVSTTNRYTIFQEEACLSARRFIKSGETIKYLSGIQVVITVEEEAALSKRKKDFSIIVSSRKKEVNLFMGPARFSNHDCNANARLVTTGQAGIEIIATRSIGVGEEITVTYGNGYFGQDNCECLCKTCEDNLTNGWAQEDGRLPVKQSVEDGSTTPMQGYSLRKREENSFHRGKSETPTLTHIAKPKVSRACLRKLQRNASTVASTTIDREDVPYSQKRERATSLLATPPVSPAKRQKVALSVTSPNGGSLQESFINGSDLAVASQFPFVSDNNDPILETDTVAEAEVLIGVTEHDGKQIPTRSIFMAASDTITAIIGTAVTGLEVEKPAIIDGSSLPTPESSLDSDGDEKAETKFRDEPSKESENEETAVQKHQPVRRRKQRGRKKMGIRAAPVQANSEIEEVKRLSTELPRRRVPGDYTLTPLLLAEPETAWVICTVCTNAFVQRNAYVTRISCSRCERHSKLYGYMWPKTEPEGNWDKEERILDHRLVHRFLPTGDETSPQGRKRWERQNDNTTTTEDGDPTGAKKENLGAGIWRKSRYTIQRELAEKASKSVKLKRELAEAAAAKSTKRKYVRKAASNTAKTKITKTATVTKLATISTTSVKPAASIQQAQPVVVKRKRGRPPRIAKPSYETQHSEPPPPASTITYSEWDFVA